MRWPQAGDAGVTIVTYEPAGFGKLRSSVFAFAFEGIGRGQESAEIAGAPE